MDISLKNCPFCGSENISSGENMLERRNGEVVVQTACLACHAAGPEVPESSDADAAWQARASEPMWISVDERVPTEDADCVILAGHVVTTCRFSVAEGFLWVLVSEAAVTHWMPLPAPPLPETNND